MTSEREGSSRARQSQETSLAEQLACLPQLALYTTDPERTKALVHQRLFDTRHHLLRVGPFELVRTLGRGGMGVVYEALDPLRGERVALKMLHGRGPTQLYQLKREFRSLSELSHPNLIGLHDLYVDNQDAYFSMELVQGRAFDAYASDAAQAHFEQALLQLCAGLRALHVAGKLHRDLKPQNVLVTSAGRVVLLDFGLAHTTAAASGSAAGTPEYMAPEQAEGRPCEASDWYGFGMLLRLALYARQQTGRPRTPALEALACQLLERSPCDRPDWHDVHARLGCGGARAVAAPARCASPGFVPSNFVPSNFVPSNFVPSNFVPSNFVGRTHELQQMDAALRRSVGEPVLLRLRGESGIGKSALLQQFVATSAHDRGALVLSGRCYERESVPYKALDGVMDALSQYLLSLPTSETLLCPEDAQALLHVFPVLARAPALRCARHSARTARPLELLPQAVNALRCILRRLSARQPLVICIDDLQWSDADSGRLLAELLGDESAPRLLVLCSDRMDAQADNAALAELRRFAEVAPSALQITELTVGPLAEGDALALASALLQRHELPPDTPACVAAESHGSPLLATELAHFAASRGTTRAGQPPLTAEAMFEHRLRGLDPRAARVLQLVAASGRPVSAAVIARATRLDARTSFTITAQLRRARLVRAVLHGGAELLALHHDRIAQLALDPLTTRERRGLHARLARALQAVEGAASDGLLDQYLAAEHLFHAAQCARRAGATALRTLAFARAARLFSQALELGSFEPHERSALERDLALALEHAGRPIEAAAALRRAALCCADRLDAVLLLQRAAQHLLNSGKRQQGEHLLRHCYTQLGLNWPEGRLQLLASIGQSLWRTGLSSMNARSDHGAALQRARVELTGAIGTALEQQDVLRALHNTLLCLEAASQLPEPSWRARILGTRGLLRSAGLSPGGAARGLRELRQACEDAAQLRDPDALSDLRRLQAAGLLICGQPGAALASARACEAQLRALALPPLQRYEVVAIIGCALYELGELQELRRSWRTFAHEARMHGDLLIQLWIHVHPARFALLFATGARDQAQALLDQQAGLVRQHPEQRGIAWAHALCSVEAALYWDEPERALQLAYAKRRALFGSGYPFLTRLSRQLRARCALASAALGQGKRARLIAAAARDSAVLQYSARGLHQGTADLLAAGLASARGQRERALRKLASALPTLLHEQAGLLTACTQHIRGTLLGGEHGLHLQRCAQATMHAQGICDPERWVRWTVPGFTLTTE